MNKHPKVSVAVMVYNQAPYIARALDSVLSQRTPFDVEILVHDDASTDGTQEIIETYRAAHPDALRTIQQSENQFSRGRRIIQILWPELHGDYIALLDGDDEWTRSDKLALQAAFLDANPGCALCQGRTRYVDGETGRRIRSFPPRRHRSKRRDLADLAAGNFVQTSNLMIRRSALPEIPAEFATLPFGDYALIALAARNGWIGYIDEETALYRIHGTNMWATQPESDRIAKTEAVRSFIASYLPVEERAVWQQPLQPPKGLRKVARTLVRALKA